MLKKAKSNLLGPRIGSMNQSNSTLQKSTKELFSLTFVDIMVFLPKEKEIVDKNVIFVHALYIDRKNGPPTQEHS